MASRSTREQLITTAERLFAMEGIDAVSLRQIAEAAGQRNPFVVQYHFGGKAELLRAIVEYRVKPYNERRLELVEALDAAGTPCDLKGLVEATVLPFVELEPADSHYVRFLSRLTTHALAFDVFEGLADEFGSSAHVVEARLEQALADVPPALRANRSMVAFSTGLYALADYQHRHAAGAPDLLPPDLFVDDLIEGIAGFLSAPLPANTAARLRKKPRITTPPMKAADSRPSPSRR